jgi:hypothetical protein
MSDQKENNYYKLQELLTDEEKKRIKTKKLFVNLTIADITKIYPLLTTKYINKKAERLDNYIECFAIEMRNRIQSYD